MMTALFIVVVLSLGVAAFAGVRQRRITEDLATRYGQAVAVLSLIARGDLVGDAAAHHAAALIDAHGIEVTPQGSRFHVQFKRPKPAPR